MCGVLLWERGYMKQASCMSKGKSVTLPLSRYAILSLHALLLTPGMHAVSFHSVAKGRRALRALLGSLNCFSSVGILSVAPVTGISASWRLIYEDMYQSSAFRDQSNFSQFFIDHFHYDCIIIEETPALRCCDWYQRVMRAIKDMHLDAQRSICIISYDN